MKTPVVASQASPELALAEFLSQGGWPEEFVNETSAYKWSETGRDGSFSTGNQFQARLNLRQVDDRWIVVGAELTCSP